MALLAAALGAAAPAVGAMAECNGVFLPAAAIESCLDQPAQPGGMARSWARNLTVTHKDKATEPPATVNLWVNFDFDSIYLSNDARIALDQVARALRGQRLAGKAFIVAGHTDAVGTADYNQLLSERRANAVRDYLSGSGQVAADRLKAEGWGFSRPLNAADPMAAENRRVEIKLAD